MANVPLSERQERILRLLVREYTLTTRAVGSKTVVERGGLEYSSATVRNDMAMLERLGFIHQLHTSGGRVPTDIGYRYYVERLMGRPVLPTNEQMMVRHQFHQVEVHLDEWIKLAASVLARMAGNVAVVTTPRAHLPRVKSIELVGVQERTALLVLVTGEGAVRQAMIPVPEPLDQAGLRGAADRMSAKLRDRGRADVLALAPDLSSLDRIIAEEAAHLLQNLEEALSAEVVYDGLGNMLQLPEFSAQERAGRLVDVLRGGALLSLLPEFVAMAAGAGRDERVQVLIGTENRSEVLRDFSIVVATYGLPDDISGLVGVLGPTRMYYERAISSVTYVSQVLSDLLGELYGGQGGGPSALLPEHS